MLQANFNQTQESHKPQKLQCNPFPLPRTINAINTPIPHATLPQFFKTQPKPASSISYAIIYHKHLLSSFNDNVSSSLFMV